MTLLTSRENVDVIKPLLKEEIPHSKCQLLIIIVNDNNFVVCVFLGSQ